MRISSKLCKTKNILLVSFVYFFVCLVFIFFFIFIFLFCVCGAAYFLSIVFSVLCFCLCSIFVKMCAFVWLLSILFVGLYSVYTNWRSIEIMFHVSTLLPYEKHDPQKLQRKRHIGNDIVCVVFLEADNTPFSPACIKSHFLHTFILVRPIPSSSQIKMTFDMQQVRVSARIKRKPTRYEVSVVTRDEVGAYKPYLWEQSVFEKGAMFRLNVHSTILIEYCFAWIFPLTFAWVSHFAGSGF